MITIQRDLQYEASEPGITAWTILVDQIPRVQVSLTLDVNNRTIEVNWIGAIDEDDYLGPGIMRKGLNLIKEQYPWAKKIVAERLSGSNYRPDMVLEI